MWKYQEASREAKILEGSGLSRSCITLSIYETSDVYRRPPIMEIMKLLISSGSLESPLPYEVVVYLSRSFVQWESCCIFVWKCLTTISLGLYKRSELLKQALGIASEFKYDAFSLLQLQISCLTSISFLQRSKRRRVILLNAMNAFALTVSIAAL